MAGATDLLEPALKIEQAVAAGIGGRAGGIEAASVVFDDQPEMTIFERKADADFAGVRMLDDVVQHFLGGEIQVMPDG